LLVFALLLLVFGHLGGASGAVNAVFELPEVFGDGVCVDLHNVGTDVH